MKKPESPEMPLEGTAFAPVYDADGYDQPGDEAGMRGEDEPRNASIARSPTYRLTKVTPLASDVAPEKRRATVLAEALKCHQILLAAGAQLSQLVTLSVSEKRHPNRARAPPTKKRPGLPRAAFPHFH